MKEKQLCWTCENCTSAIKCKFVARIDKYYKKHKKAEEIPYIKDITKYYIEGTKTDKQGNITYCPCYKNDNLDHRTTSQKLEQLANECNKYYDSNFITSYNTLLEFEQRLSLITEEEKQRRQKEFARQVEQKKNNEIKQLNIKNVDYNKTQTNSKPLTKKQLEMKAKREKQEQIAEQKRQAKLLKQELLQSDKEIKQNFYYTKDEKQALLNITNLDQRKSLRGQYDEYYSQKIKIYNNYNFMFSIGHYVRYATPNFEQAIEYAKGITNTMLQKRLLQYIKQQQEIYRAEKQRQQEIYNNRSKAQKVVAERKRQEKLNKEKHL